MDTTTVNASFDGQEVDASGDSFIVTVENLTAGVHKFVVTCADTSGNVATSTTTINVKDTEAPTVSITTDKENTLLTKHLCLIMLFLIIWKLKQ